MFSSGSSPLPCCHSGHSLSHCSLRHPDFIRKEDGVERCCVFTTILYHMAPVTPGHSCQEDRCPITAAVIGTLGGPNQYHIPCLFCTTNLLCYLNLQLLSGSSKESRHFISSLVHGHTVQHRCTAPISKITETV